MKSRRLSLVLVAMVALAACGTRLPDAAFENSATGVQGDALGRPTDASATLLGDFATDTTAVGAGESGTARRSNAAAGNRAASRDEDAAPNEASDAGITESTITIGNITAENGALGDAFAPAVRGVRAWVAAQNARGGIRGRKIVLKTCDDREDRNRTLQCAQQLVERDKVFALVGTNTRAMGGAAQYLADREIPVLGMPINNSFYRYPTFFSQYRTYVQRDGQNVGYKGNIVTSSGYFRWFRQTMNVSKAAVFSYDIDESKQAGNLFTKGLELEGFQVTQYVVSFAAPSFDSAVAEMERSGIEIVFDSMDDGANRKLCDAMGRRQFTVKAKVATIVGLGQRVTEYNDACRQFAYAVGFTRNYEQTTVPEIARFREAYRRYQPQLSLHQWALEAWMLANLTAKYLDTAAPTRKGFVAYLNSLRDYTGDGIHTGLDWGKFDPTAPRVRDCFTVHRWNDNTRAWTDAIGTYPFCYPDAHQFHSPALENGN